MQAQSGQLAQPARCSIARLPAGPQTAVAKMSFMNKELSDDLLPFSGKLSERFYEVRENVAGFCAEIEKIGAQLGSLPTRRPPLAHTAAPCAPLPFGHAPPA